MSVTSARTSSKPASPSSEARLGLLRQMIRIREIELRIVALYGEQEMRCPTHLSIGQEAVAAGVLAHLHREDYVLSAHRNHAHYIAKGGDLRAMFAELYGKATGCARGKGGSMHLIDRKVGFLGCVPIVGSTIAIGVGASFGDRLQGKAGITAIFFGEGAAETGVFNESLNFASLHRLPVLFVCENNFYSVLTPLADRQPANRTVADLARGHGIPAERGDGQDVERVHAMTAAAMAKIRADDGPRFLEFETYRWLEHCGPLSDVEAGLRPAAEFALWQKRDPVELYRVALVGDGTLSKAGFEAMVAAARAEIDDAVAFAQASPFPERHELSLHVFPERRP
jgi:TPP-dependent pyruvate/acetoin dehydrogenase alpha subunit